MHFYSSSPLTCIHILQPSPESNKVMVCWGAIFSTILRFLHRGYGANDRSADVSDLWMEFISDVQWDLTLETETKYSKLRLRPNPQHRDRDQNVGLETDAHITLYRLSCWLTCNSVEIKFSSCIKLRVDIKIVVWLSLRQLQWQTVKSLFHCYQFN